MTESDLILVGIDKGVRFYHQSDERAFFEWLKRIPCIKGFVGEGERGLVLRLNRRPHKADLLELLAICRRYGVDMRQLAKFENSANRRWFRDRNAFWHSAVFGDAIEG